MEEAAPTQEDPTQEEERQRRDWRRLWLSALQAFADKETQEGRWLDKTERNPHFSLVECLCCYFDDAYLGEDHAYERGLASGRVTPGEVAAVAEFHALAQAYKSPGGNDWDAGAVLRDPKWQEVVDAAQAAQRRLLPLLTDSSEKAALTQPVHWEWEAQDGAFVASSIGSRNVPSGGPGGVRVAARTSSGAAGLLGKLLRKLFGAASQ
jgi:hypothetical protein